uniref:Uncharacterized protein n=1 Tax=Oryza glumipatula TaxID=40148 RepID=A0A0D9YV91_9ORYZ
MVQIDDEASSMVRSSLNGLDWLPDADGGIGVGDADSEGSWVAADSGDWWLEDQRRQRLHPGVGAKTMIWRALGLMNPSSTALSMKDSNGLHSADCTANVSQDTGPHSLI